MSGVSRLQYNNSIRFIRVMCSGRVDLEFILRAFHNGQDGVFIGGCRLNECNYITQGNYDALGNTLLCKKILSFIGINPDRLSIQFMNASDGILLADSINSFDNTINSIGPIGNTEGIEQGLLKLKIDSVRSLVPYIRLVERERLRVPLKIKEEYIKHFDSDEISGIIEELIFDKIGISQILMLLKGQSLSTADISTALGLKPSDVSKHISNSSNLGLVRYDTKMKAFSLT